MAFALAAVGYRAPQPIITGQGDLWLDPGSSCILGLVQLDGAGEASFTLPMTPAVLFGRVLCVQSALLLPSSTIALSPPAFTALLPPVQ